MDKDLDPGFDKSAPPSARYHNLGPAEAGKFNTYLTLTYCWHGQSHLRPPVPIITKFLVLCNPLSTS